jgi:hypothetical protein
LVSELEAQKLSSERKINSTSVKILRQSGQHTEESVAERLSRPIGTVKQKTLESIDQPTFQPTIVTKSKEGSESTARRGEVYTTSPSSSSSVPSPGFYKFSEEYPSTLYEDRDWDRREREGESLYELSLNDQSSSSFTLDPSYHPQGRGGSEGGSGNGAAKGPTGVYLRSQRWQQEKEARRRKEQLLREEQELNECSFRPKIKDSRGAEPEEWHEGGRGGGGKSMAERQAEWQRRRDEKVERERREKEIKDLAECSFAPSLGGNGGGGSGSSLSKPTKAKESNSSGQTLSQFEPPAPPPPRVVPKIGPRATQRTASSDLPPAPASPARPSSSSLYSSHPQEYMSPASALLLESRERDGQWQGNEWESSFPLPPPNELYEEGEDEWEGEEGGEGYFLQGSSQFLDYSPEAEVYGEEEYDEDEGYGGGGGRYLSYPPEEDEEEEPEQYPLPRDDEEEDWQGRDLFALSRSHPDGERGDVWRNECHDPYEMEEGDEVGEGLSFSVSGSGVGMYSAPPPPPSSYLSGTISSQRSAPPVPPSSAPRQRAFNQHVDLL